VIDFRYHLVSIVAVFLALAIGIVLGSTELQGPTLDALRSYSSSLKNQLSAVSSQRDSYRQLLADSDAFVQSAGAKLVSDALTGDRVVMITEPGAPSGVISGVTQAVTSAGATVTGTVTLQPKFNDLSGGTQSTLYSINAQQGSADGTTFETPASSQTEDEQQAAQLIAGAVLAAAAGEPALTTASARTQLAAYSQAGFLSVTGTPYDDSARATLAVVITPDSAPTDQNDPANQVLLAVAAQFAGQSAATLVAGSNAGSSPATSAISVLRGSNVASQVSSVDNADTTMGQVSAVWALADQLAGGKPDSYGISGASAVSPPVPSTVPTATPTPTGTPSSTATGKVKKTVNSKS
jgi:hypothetical protein